MKKGYKETKLGWIPEDWEVKLVGEAFNICNSLRFPISENERDKIKGDYPYYGPTKIQGFIDKYRIDGKYALIGEDGDHFLKWKELEMTLLIEGQFNVNNHAHVIQGNDNLTEWFFYYFNNKELTPYLTRQGAGRYKLTKESLRKIPCLLPKIEEQKAIVDCLSTWDNAITTQSKLIKAKEMRLKALMQKLLTGEKRLAGYTDEWGFTKFDDFYTENKIKANDSKYEVLSVTKNGIVSQSEYFNKEIASSDTSKYLVVKQNDFVMSGLNFWMGSYDVLNNFEIGIVSPAYKVYRLKKAYNSTYFSFLVKSKAMLDAMVGCSVIGASIVRRNFDKEILHEWSFKIPSFEEQNAIATILKTAEKEIQIEKQKLADLQKQRKGLMQQLLTGKVRLV